MRVKEIADGSSTKYGIRLAYKVKWHRRSRIGALSLSGGQSVYRRVTWHREQLSEAVSAIERASGA